MLALAQAEDVARERDYARLTYLRMKDLEVRIDAMIARQQELHAAVDVLKAQADVAKEKLTEHAGRIREAERELNGLMAKVAAAGGLLTLLIPPITSYINRRAAKRDKARGEG